MAGTRICVVADVDGLIVSWLNFWDRRRLAQVNKHYWRLLGKEALAIPCCGRDESSRLSQYASNDNVEACQWLLMKYQRSTIWKPALTWNISLDLLLYWGAVKVLQWRQSIGPRLLFEGAHLRKALHGNHLKMADYLLSEDGGGLQLSSEELFPLLQDPGNWSSTTFAWVDQLYRRKAYSVNWSSVFQTHQQIFSLVEWPLRDWSVYGWFLQQGVDFQLYLHLFPCEATVLQWAETSLHVDFSSSYDHIYEQAMEKKSLSLVLWLLERGFSPPTSSQALTPNERQALELLYLHHYPDLFSS